MIIKVDLENSAEKFWEHVFAATEAESCPPAIVALTAGQEWVEVSKEKGEAIKAWCQAAPGFSDGPEYARDALIFEDNHEHVVFGFDEQLFSLADMLDVNAHDEDLCAWLKTANVGETFLGCTRIS